MRPIKFRARYRYNPNDKIDFEYFDFKELTHAHMKQDDYQDWGQYTGLHDKNGKEIYESDFLELAKEWYLVEWHFNRWVLRDTHNKIHEFHKLSLDAGWYEVVGNNYENR